MSNEEREREMRYRVPFIAEEILIMRNKTIREKGNGIYGRKVDR